MVLKIGLRPTLRRSSILKISRRRMRMTLAVGQLYR